MNLIEPLEHDRYYHIYNRGINSGELFREKDDYIAFLDRFQKYISPIAEIFVWCLMNNHFHFLVKIKEYEKIGFFILENNSSRSAGLWKVVTPADLPESGGPGSVGGNKLKKLDPSRQFSHLFNSYAKWFNDKYERTGSLFEKNFRRILIDSDEYFKRLVYYIHQNPIHHGISNKISEYTWSSYQSFMKANKHKFPVTLENTIEWFGSYSDFIDFHRQQHDNSKIENLLIDD